MGGSSVNAAANKSWPKFFAEFRAAVIKRDRAALKKMISSEFDWTASELGISPDDVLTNLDNDEARQKGQPRMWILLQRSLVFSRFRATEYGSRPARSNYSRNAAYCFLCLRLMDDGVGNLFWVTNTTWEAQ